MNLKTLLSLLPLIEGDLSAFMSVVAQILALLREHPELVDEKGLNVPALVKLLKESPAPVLDLVQKVLDLLKANPKLFAMLVDLIPS